MVTKLFCWFLIIYNVNQLQSASIDSDSYLSAYKLTHDLNNHFENRPTGEKVIYVDANTDQHIDVHPVYVQETHTGLIDHAAESSFHAVDHDHAQHADHLDVEHHYQPEYHEHFIDVKDSNQGLSNSGVNSAPSGLGNYGAPVHTAIDSYGPPASGFSSSEAGYPTSSPVNTYGPPVPVTMPKKMPSGVYGPPSPVYGPPSPVYGPPAPVYQPVPVYGPPAHHIGVYGPPHHKLPPLVAHEYYEPEPPSVIPEFITNLITPHAFLTILDKIKWFKLDLFTIGKLILKFFIFKKFLMFFTILFLLLVIPALKHKGKESVGMMTAMVDKFGQEDDDDDDDESRKKGRKARMFINKATESINAITSHVLESIENFEKKMTVNEINTKPSTIIATDLNQLSNSVETDCKNNNTSIYCKSQSIIDKIKTIMPARDDLSAEIKKTDVVKEKKTTKVSKTSTPTMTTIKPTITTTSKLPVNKYVVNLTSKSQLKQENNHKINKQSKNGKYIEKKRR